MKHNYGGIFYDGNATFIDTDIITAYNFTTKTEKTVNTHYNEKPLQLVNLGNREYLHSTTSSELFFDMFLKCNLLSL